MGNTRDTGHLRNVIAYDGSGRIAVGGAIDSSYIANFIGSVNIDLDAIINTITVGIGGSTDPLKSNTAVGFEALSTVSVSTENTAIGYQALKNSIYYSNTAIGYQSLKTLTEGQYNVSVGADSMWRATTGEENTAIGYSSLDDITTGSYNVAIGYGAGGDITTGSGNICIGYNASGTASMTNNIIIKSGGGVKAQHDGTNWTFTGGTTITGVLTGTSATFTDYLNVGSPLSGATGVYNFVVSGANAGIYFNRIGNPAFIRLTQDDTGGGQLRSLSTGGILFTAADTTEWARITSGSITSLVPIIGTSVELSSGITFTTTQTIGTAGQIGYNSTSGLSIRGKAGSAYDFSLDNATGGTVLYNPTGTTNLVLAGALTGTSATFSGAITSTVTVNAILAATTASTSTKYINITNTGSATIFGVESSTGASLFAGTTAYATIVGTGSARPIQFVTDNTVRYTIDASGNNTWTGAGTFGGALTGTSATFKTNTTGAKLDVSANWGATATNDIALFSRYGDAVQGSIGYSDVSGAIYFGTKTDHQVELRQGGDVAISVGTNLTTTLAGALTGTSATFSGTVTSTYNGAAAVLINSSGNTNPQYIDFSNTGGRFLLGNNNSGGSSLGAGGLAYSTVLMAVGSTALQLGTNSTVRYTMDASGNNTWTGDGLFGRTSAGLSNTSGVSIYAAGGLVSEGTSYQFYGNRTTSDGLFMGIRRNNVDVGSISVTTTATAFNTSSDYRLKQDFRDFSGTDLLMKMKFYDFEWKINKSRSYGVIAHEIAEVVPYSVFGEKDGEQSQSVDYSKSLPIVGKALQEALIRIEELENEVQILKNK